MKDKYTVKEFCEKYNSASTEEAESYLMDILNIHYVPYERKITICEAIVENTYYIKTKRNNIEIKKLHVNSPANYMFYCLNLVREYTNLEVNFKDSINEFNLLNGGDILDMIYTSIPERELKEFRMILDMIESDVIQNEYEPHAFISNQIERFGELFGTAVKPVVSVLRDALKNVDKNTVNSILKELKERKE